ncbi:MAG: TetR/AcrR family transcriptional regulator [Lachnospiraceae bacterium]|nr:TetR/AcrR family transcriptional regulator [Lachnospiraceae bacterium]
MGKRQIAAMQTRLKIITAAEKLIKERGFENVTIDEIAAEAGVAKGSFYTYFKRKEDVVGEIAKATFIEMQKKSMKVEGDVCDQLASFLRDSMKYIKESTVKISQQWIKNVVEPENEDGKNKLLYDQSVVKGILEQAVGQGELAKETPVDNLTECIAAQYYGIVFCWSLLDGAFDPISRMEEYCYGQLKDSLIPYRNKKFAGTETEET